MGIEKKPFTLRADAENMQLVKQSRKVFPLASDSAIGNHLLTLARVAIENGVISLNQLEMQAIPCSERSGVILAWMLQIATDPQVQIAQMAGPRKADKPPESKVKRA